MTFWQSLKRTNQSHLEEAVLSLVYNLVGSLAPVWFGFLLLTLFSRHPTSADFSQHGEFALYSSAMFAPALFIVFKDLRIPGFPGRPILGLLCIAGMITSTCFFAAVTTAFMSPTPVLVIDQGFLQHGTLLLFACSVFLAFLITVIDNSRTPPDVRKLEAKDLETLNKQFDELGGGE